MDRNYWFSFFTLWTALVGTFVVYAALAVPPSQPDNTLINQRDKSVTELTATDQSNSPQALETTRKIRAELVKDKNLSVYAKNIKVIALRDHLTLKGPVHTNAERARILEIASAIAPSYQIENQIEVIK